MGMTEFTDAQQERVDLVENAAHDFLCRVVPGYSEWDTDLVVSTLEAVWEHVLRDRGVCTEMEFFPYRESE